MAKARVGLNQLIIESDALAQIEGPRHVRDKIVRAAFDQETVAMDGLQHSAQSRTRLKQRQLGLRNELDDSVGGGEPGDTSADNGHSNGGLSLRAGHTLSLRNQTLRKTDLAETAEPLRRNERHSVDTKGQKPRIEHDLNRRMRGGLRPAYAIGQISVSLLAWSLP